MTRATFVVALLLATAAAAENRVAVLPFKGPKASAVRAQVVKKLCKVEQCVKPGKDGSTVPVDGVVLGKVRKVKGKLTLELAVYTSPDDPPAKKRYLLKRTGGMTPKALAGVVAHVQKNLDGGEDAEEADTGAEDDGTAEDSLPSDATASNASAWSSR